MDRLKILKISKDNKCIEKEGKCEIPIDTVFKKGKLVSFEKNSDGIFGIFELDDLSMAVDLKNEEFVDLYQTGGMLDLSSKGKDTFKEVTGEEFTPERFKKFLELLKNEGEE